MGVGRCARLIGRDEEVRRLRVAADEARAGTARVVVVGGEPGIGKTRLVADFLGEVRDAGEMVLTGHGVNLAGGELAYGVATEVLLDLVRQVGLEEVRHAAGPHAALLAPLHPAFGGDASPVSTSVDRAHLFGAMNSVLLDLSRDRMVCLFVDDLQWVDASSRDLLVYLAKASTYTRFLLICAVRSAPQDTEPIARDLDELSRTAGGDRVTLAALLPDQVSDNVKEASGGDLSSELLDHVQRASEGVPLFVEELLAEGERLSPALRVYLAARMAGLGEGTLRFLQAAAVGAGHALEGLTAAASGLSADAASRARRDATSRGLLLESTDAEIRFYHTLFRDAVLDGMLSTELAECHRRWAEQVERATGQLPPHGLTMMLAQHWHACGDNRRALPAGVKAARNATRRGGLAEA